jgi:hypothetical protein
MLSCIDCWTPHSVCRTRIICCSDSTETMGTEQTHVVPAKVPLPLWLQPAHHHKMPQSHVCL